MHKHKILHRDIKPENIVLVHVLHGSFRETSNYVTSGGQSTRRKNSEAPSVGLPYTSLLNSFRVHATTRRWTFGQLASSPTSYIMEIPLSTSMSTKIS
jgi:serine/threonine protein kinase